MISSKFKDNLGEILEFVRESAKQAKDFAQEQVPIFIQELVTYYFFFHLISILILSIFVVMFIWVGNRIRTKEFDLRDGDNESLWGLCFVFYTLGVITFVPTVFHILDLIKVWTAPRLYLLEYASDIINGGGC